MTEPAPFSAEAQGMEWAKLQLWAAVYVFAGLAGLLIQLLYPSSIEYFASLVDFLWTPYADPFGLFFQLYLICGLAAAATIPGMFSPAAQFGLRLLLAMTLLGRRFNFVLLGSDYDISLLVFCFLALLVLRVVWNALQVKTQVVFNKTQWYLQELSTPSLSRPKLLAIDLTVSAMEREKVLLLVLKLLAPVLVHLFSFASEYRHVPPLLSWRGVWQTIVTLPLSMFPLLALVVFWSRTTMRKDVWFLAASLCTGVSQVAPLVAHESGIAIPSAVVSVILQQPWPSIVIGAIHMYCYCVFSGNEPLKHLIGMQAPEVLASGKFTRVQYSNRVISQGLAYLALWFWTHSAVVRYTSVSAPLISAPLFGWSGYVVFCCLLLLVPRRTLQYSPWLESILRSRNKRTSVDGPGSHTQEQAESTPKESTSIMDSAQQAQRVSGHVELDPR